MAVDRTHDPVLHQLRKLRVGPGLRLPRLEASGAVMSALGTSDVQEAYNRLMSALGTLSSKEQAAALEVDLSLNLPRHLGRAPSDREVDWLGDRRSGYAEVVGRDVKTLARWSDKVIAELRDSLIKDTFAGHLVVVAAVRRDRVLGFTVAQQTERDGGMESETQHIDNPSKEPSPPCFVYGYPRDWRPATLTLSVTFLEEPHSQEVWAVVADSFFSIAFGEERYPLRINQGSATCRIQSPRRDRLYAVCWR